MRRLTTTALLMTCVPAFRTGVAWQPASTLVPVTDETLLKPDPTWKHEQRAGTLPLVGLESDVRVRVTVTRSPRRR